MCGCWKKRAMVLLFRVVTLLYLRKMRHEIQATDVPLFNSNKKQTAEKTLFCSSSTRSVCCKTAILQQLSIWLKVKVTLCFLWTVITKATSTASSMNAAYAQCSKHHPEQLLRVSWRQKSLRGFQWDHILWPLSEWILYRFRSISQ